MNLTTEAAYRLGLTSDPATVDLEGQPESVWDAFQAGQAARYAPSAGRVFACGRGSIEIEEGPINLDGMSRDELLIFFHIAEAQTSAVAQHMFPTRMAYSTVKNLAKYALRKAHAVGRRLRGDIADATLYEGQCDRHYARIPKYARW